MIKKINVRGTTNCRRLTIVGKVTKLVLVCGAIERYIMGDTNG
jgi:hypothetical protein